MAYLGQGFPYPQYVDPADQKLAESFYCWDEQDGFRMLPMHQNSMQTTNIQMSNMRSANPRRPVRKPLPLRIPEVAETADYPDSGCADGVPPGRISPDDTSSVKSQGREQPRSNSRSSLAESPSSPLFSHPVFSPSQSPRGSPVPFSLNRTPSLPNALGKKCVCGAPEPVLKRANSLGGALNHRTDQSRASSMTSCICKFSPTLEDAKLMVMPGQSARPRVVSHRQRQRSLTALPDMSEAPTWLNSSFSLPPLGSVPPNQLPYRPHSRSSLRSVHTLDLESQNPPPIPTRNHHQHTTSHYPFISPPMRAPTTTTRSVHSDTQSEAEEPAHAPPVLIYREPSHDQLRRALYRWSLVRLSSNILFIGVSLTIVILLIWPAVEQSRFPITNYGVVPQLITVTHHPTNGKPGPAANVTTTTTEVQLVKLGTTDAPEAVLQHDAQLTAQAESPDSATTKDTDTPKRKGEPDGYFAMPPFWRTFHAEFRKQGFPALILGLSILAVLQLAGNVFEAVSLSPKLERADELPLVKEKRSVLDAKSSVKTWKEWKRGVGWREHRGQCVIAAKVGGLFAAVRAAFVVLVLVVLVLLAVAKVNAGKAAPWGRESCEKGFEIEKRRMVGIEERGPSKRSPDGNL